MRFLCIAALLFIVSPALPVQIRNVEEGRDVGDGMVLYDCPYDPKKVSHITFVSPSVDHPFYEIVIPMGDWTEGKNASIKTVTVNGVSCDSYYVFVDGFSHVQSGWITNRKTEAPNVVLVARSLWHNNEATTVEVTISATVEDGSSRTINKSYTVTAPLKGGGPEGWRRYQSFVVRETAGQKRSNEPVEMSITVREEDCADLEREFRVFAQATDGRSWTPAPFQVFNVRRFEGTPPGTTNPNYLQHPSRSLDAITPVTIGPNSARVYLAVYDNPETDSVSPAETDLSVAGPSLGATVENTHFVVNLSSESGQIASFDLKGSAVPRLTNSLSRAVHWNPDSFSDNGLWGHTFSWNPPDRTVVTTRGPLLFRITNSGRMPGETPEVDVSVTYSFYPGVPYVMATSSMNLRDVLNASAIRDGEIVLDSHLITHFVWREKTGGIKTIRTLHGATWQDEWAYRVDVDVPWIAMTNELDDYGVGTAIVSVFSYNPTYGEATLHRPAFYLYYHHFWAIPLTYFTRAWVYPFSDYQRGPILPVQQDSTYVSKAAFIPFRLHDNGERYREIDDISKQLLNPLEVRWGR